MSQVNHITNVRPGDRWDGVALNIHKTSFDWSQAQVTVQLRLGVRGPLVANIAFSQSAAVDTLVLGFYLTAADTAKLRLGSTYYGTVTVQIPNANPALEPTFGPYTLFTWAMEMSDRAQSGSETYTVEFGSSTVFNISLNEGSTITISGGGDGGGSGAPSAHAATHKHGGSDEVATGTPSANAIPKADANGKLDVWVSSGAAAGTASLRVLGTGALHACAGNDARLSDSRTPVAHTHPVGEVTGLGGAATLNVGSSAGTVCAGNDSRLSDNRTPTAHAASHKHGGADEVAVATPAANAIPKADGVGKLDAWITSGGAAATPSLRILGTAATDACAGNDARLSDARTPSAHAASHKHGGSDEIATATPAANAIPKANGAGKLDAWVTASSGGGLSNGSGFTISDHFLYDTYGTNTGYWVVALTGSASVSTVAPGASDSNRPGQVQLSTAASATANPNMCLARSGMFAGGGALTFEASIKIGGGLSDGTDTYVAWLGFHDDKTTNNAADGIYVDYVQTASVNWRLCTAKGGTRTQTASSVAVSIGTWIRVKVTVDAGATTATLFIDGTQVAQNTTNIPNAAANAFGVVFGLLKSLGTAARTMTIDWAQITQTFTTST